MVESIVNVSDMLAWMMQAYNIPPKVLASECRYSKDAIWSAAKGARAIPTKARQKLARKNIAAAAAVALEATGFKRLFGVRKYKDRHVQTMVLRWKKECKEVMSLADQLPELLLDKVEAADMSSEEMERLSLIVRSMADQMNGTMNMIMEFEIRFGVEVTGYLSDDKEKPPGSGRSRTA